jgi:Lipocalin-like domain
VRRQRLTLGAAGALIVLPVLSIGSSSADDHGASGAEAKARVVRQLAGSWQLVSFALRSPDGTLSYPFGKDAVGKLTYTRDGNQWAGLGRRGVGKNLPDALWYTGRFDINLRRHTVIHHVRYSNITAYEGNDLVRSYKLGRNRLTLTIAPTSPGGQTGVLKWTRQRVHAVPAVGLSE